MKRKTRKKLNHFNFEIIGREKFPGVEFAYHYFMGCHRLVSSLCIFYSTQSDIHGIIMNPS